MSDPRGADIRIYERTTDDKTIILPNMVRINGVDILTAEESSIEVHQNGIGHPVTVDIKGIMVRSLTFDQEKVERSSRPTRDYGTCNMTVSDTTGAGGGGVAGSFGLSAGLPGLSKLID